MPINLNNSIDPAHASNIDNNPDVKYVYDYLRSLKDKDGNSILTPQHVAGIMGNMYQESHFNPNANSGKYKGLVQMSPSLWSYYETYLNNNKIKNTVANQLKYLGEIFTNRNNHSPFGIEGQHIYRNEWGGSGRQDKFITTPYKTAGEAAAAFADLFERQGANDTTSRSNYANYISQTYNYKQGGILKRVVKAESGIHIKPENEGKLTRLKQTTGKTEAELWQEGNHSVKKMITFARNARKWNH